MESGIPHLHAVVGVCGPSGVLGSDGGFGEAESGVDTQGPEGPHTPCIVKLATCMSYIAQVEGWVGRGNISGN